MVVHNDEDVIHVMEDVIIHEVLEGGGGVGYIKGHHKVLEEAVMGVGGSFPFMSWGYTNIVVTRVEVYFSIHLSAVETVNKVTNEEKGILVLFGDFVEALVVNTEA
ncbi:hypothetical protein C0993_009389 [Termitomyces sp. T159_Od127]|nr:hypothetical protein C0993_009389 [Termitomyces sp. T159_Od127]